MPPAFPPFRPGTTGGGVWIGEVLIDARGKVANVWTIRDVKLTPPVPSLNKVITDAVRQWTFLPAELNDVPAPDAAAAARSSRPYDRFARMAF
ncbi:MAG TPA: hypothetical protein VMZ90_03070 [Vicinamibacterales bacterium]|nr:hypothetical protein [Vicinamibacterales bacterium]